MVCGFVPISSLYYMDLLQVMVSTHEIKIYRQQCGVDYAKLRWLISGLSQWYSTMTLCGGWQTKDVEVAKQSGRRRSAGAHTVGSLISGPGDTYRWPVVGA